MTALAIQDVPRRSGRSEPTPPYQTNREPGPARAGEQQDVLLRDAPRVVGRIEPLGVDLDYLRAKPVLWEARDRGDNGAEAEPNLQVQKMLSRLEEVVLR